MFKRKNILGGAAVLSKSSKLIRTAEESDEEYDDDPDENEKDLESFLFGNNDNLIKENVFNKNEKKEDNEVLKNENDEPVEFLGFTISTKPEEDSKGDNIEFEIDGNGEKAAWTDEDNDSVQIDITEVNRLKKLKVDKKEKVISGLKFQERLKSQFEKVLPTPAWADLENISSHADALDSDYSDDENVFLSSKRVTTKSKELPQGILKLSRMKNLNQVQSSSSTITSLEFHPHAKVAFTTSLNKRLCIFQADGKENRKLQSLFLARFPIYTGHFTPDGDSIIMTSRRKHFYVYDLQGEKTVRVPEIRGQTKEKSLEKFIVSPDGKMIVVLGEHGFIHLASTMNYHLISSLKMNGTVFAATFNADGSQLYTTGSDGEVYIWDMNSQKCLHRFIDDGSLSTRSISVSNNQKYIATGSSSGIVNLYDSQCLSTKYPTPVKILKNLSTSIDGVSFDSNSEMLGYYSPQMRNSLRMLHVSSLTNFSNWPIEKQTLGNVSCMSFSPESGYLGIGNEKGHALLFRLHHYPPL